MGIQNRQRRRQKHARRDREQRRGGNEGRASRYDRWDSGSEALTVDLIIASAAEAVHHGQEGARDLIASLASGRAVAGGPRLIARRVAAALDDEVVGLRARQWLPEEVRRAARRGLGALGATIAAAAMHAEWIRHADPSLGVEWAAEAATLDGGGWMLDPDLPSWPDDLAAAIGTLGLLGHLPGLPGLGTTRGRSSDHSGPTDEVRRILDKVRGLLAKAESTSFPEEAESLTAKAQELLTRHSIDRAALAMADRSAKGSATFRRVWIDDPYVDAKAMLLHAVALANRCRSVLMGSIGLATVAGHDDDLDTVEILFTSLLVQATTQMTAAGSRTDCFGRSRTRSFRQSFLVAFATRIGQRLGEAGRASESAAADRYGSALLPVLASRESAADDAIAAMFPELVQRRTAASDREGWIAGTVAADLASLSFQQEIPGFTVGTTAN
jgi:hypothetical protein